MSQIFSFGTLILVCVLLFGAASAGCNNSRRSYAHCYCATLGGSSVAPVSSNSTCLPCQAKGVSPTPGHRHGHSQGHGQGHQNSNGHGHNKHHP